MDIDIWAIKAQKLLNELPEGYWLFAADGGIHVMKYKDGARAIEPDGGMDYDYNVIKLNGPEIDGGDW